MKNLSALYEEAKQQHGRENIYSFGHAHRLITIAWHELEDGETIFRSGQHLIFSSKRQDEIINKFILKS